MKKIKSAVCLLTQCYIEDDIVSFIDHYLNYCGFDSILIYDNNTTCCNIKKLVEHDERIIYNYVSNEELKAYECYQNKLYNEVILKYKNTFDYIAFFDDDEFLWIDKLKYNTINDFLFELYNNNIKQYVIPWIFISYNKSITDRNKNLKSECFYISTEFDKEQSAIVKPIVSTELYPARSYVHFFDNIENQYYTSYGINKQFEILHNKYIDDIEKNWYPTEPMMQLFNTTFIPNEQPLILYHYQIKSIKEYIRKAYQTVVTNTKIQLKDTDYFFYNDYVLEHLNDKYIYYHNPFNINI